MILSESEYRHQALGNILPFQDIFTSFFFISIGMLLQLEFVYQNLVLILAVCFGVLLLKGFVAGNTSLILGAPLRTSILVGFALSQVGEFAFVLAQAGMRTGMGEVWFYQLFLSVSLLTMLATPFLIKSAPFAANFVCRLPLPGKLLSGRNMRELEEEKGLANHVVITGFGTVGKNLAESCRMANVNFCVLETNLDLIRQQRKEGVPIYFGDAGHVSVLQHVNIDKASTLAVLVNSPSDERRIVQEARRENSELYIVVRTHYSEECEVLFQLGADEVVIDEFESSVQVVNRIMSRYGVSYSERDRIINRLPGGLDDMLREPRNPFLKFTQLELDLPHVLLEAWDVSPGAPLCDKAVQESNLRPEYGISILIIIRGGKNITDISGKTRILEGDKLVVFGDKGKLREAEVLFKAKAAQ